MLVCPVQRVYTIPAATGRQHVHQLLCFASFLATRVETAALTRPASSRSTPSSSGVMMVPNVSSIITDTPHEATSAGTGWEVCHGPEQQVRARRWKLNFIEGLQNARLNATAHHY